MNFIRISLKNSQKIFLNAKNFSQIFPGPFYSQKK